MNSKTKLLQFATVLFIVIGATVFVRTWANAALYSQPDPESTGYPYYLAPAAKAATTTKPGAAVAILTPDAPRRLIIPSLEINAVVQKVGVNKKGSMGVPSNYRDVAWYSKGAFPGDEGSAVIAGHYDNGLGLSGVFKYLSEIKIGDEIEIDTVSGRKIKFVVTGTQTYDYNDPAATAIFAAADGERLLRLVTCGGNWVAADKTYDKRIVVTAVPVE